MPVEIALRSGAEIVGQVSLQKDTIDNSSQQPIEVIASDAKEFSMPGLEIENIIPRPACTAPPCRGCKRPCARGIGEEFPLIKNASTKNK